MACIDHECHRCKHTWANNKKESFCPDCGHKGVSNCYDEQYDHEFEVDDEDIDDE